MDNLSIKELIEILNEIYEDVGDVSTNVEGVMRSDDEEEVMIV